MARIINRALAAKDGAIVPLIAETGGINAMLVDRTALPEQVVDAVVQSAFRSAGQRCSALRLLCVHEGIADGVIEMIRGAAAELAVGDPAAAGHRRRPGDRRRGLSTASGGTLAAPGSWKQSRWSQRRALQALPAMQLHRAAAPSRCRASPTCKQEIFGPVLHVVRWRGESAAVVERRSTRSATA